MSASSAISPQFEASDAPGAAPLAMMGTPVSLPTIIRRANMEYRCCFRERNVAVYLAKSGNRIEYETIRIDVLPAEEIGDRSYPIREAFPSSSQWGETGFSFSNNSHRDPLAAAMGKAEQMSIKEQQIEK
jgi:hypothetical protein